MSIETWGQMDKSQIDSEKIESAISRIVQTHDDDPDAHLDTNQALNSHRASEVIDHVARSIVNDKLVVESRAYTAIVKIPSVTPQNVFPSSFVDNYLFTGKEPSSSTQLAILSRGVSADDSQYIFSNTPYTDAGFISAKMSDLPTDSKIYKIKVHIRAKILNETQAGHVFTLAHVYDGFNSEYEFNPTTSWQNFEKEFYLRQDDLEPFNPDNWALTTFDINYSPSVGNNTQNQLAVSQFYVELFVVDSIDQEDFFWLPDAVAYVNSLGGGSIYIKNGVYNTGNAQMYLNSYVSIEGESLAGVVITASDTNANLQIGSSESVKYSAGSMTLTQNSSNVLFTGVTLTSANTVGKYLLNKATGHYYKIIAFVDSSNLTISEVYQGQTTASLSYTILEMFQECSIKNLTFSYEITVRQAINVTFDNCFFNVCNLYMSYLENLVVNDCDFYRTLSAQTYGDISNSKFANNTYRNYSYTVLYFTSSSHGNLVIDNLFIDNKGQGIIVNGADNIIRDNVMLNCGWTLGQLYSPVILGSTSLKNVVCNNIIRQCQSYGIGSQSGANYNICMGNICIDNGQTGIVNNGAQSITANNIV